MNNHIWIVFALISLATACVEEVTMDSMEEMPAVVNCVLTRDAGRVLSEEYYSDKPPGTTKQYLDLFYAKRPSEVSWRTIKDAKVTVSSGNEEYPFYWNGERWESDFLPEYGKVYDLTIMLDNACTITARDTFPQRMVIYPVDVAKDIKEKPWILGPDGMSVIRFGSAWIHCFLEISGEANLWIKARQGERIIDKLITSHPGADDSNVCGGSFNDFLCYKDPLPQFGGIDWGRTAYISLLKDRLDGLPVQKGYIRIVSPAGDPVSFCLAADFDVSREVEYDDPFNLDLEKDGMSPSIYIDTYFDFWNFSNVYDEYVRMLCDAELHSDEMAFRYFSPNLNRTNIVGGIGCFGSAVHCTLGQKPYKEEITYQH